MSVALTEKWSSSSRSQQKSYPTTIRLRPDVDVMLQEVLSRYPHLTQTQIINDLIYDSLIAVYSTF